MFMTSALAHPMVWNILFELLTQSCQDLIFCIVVCATYIFCSHVRAFSGLVELFHD